METFPYFSGPIDSNWVKGSDGTLISLEELAPESFLTELKKRQVAFSDKDYREQLRLATTSLGLLNLHGLNHPNINDKSSTLDIVLSLADFICERVKVFQKGPWLDTALNPVPEAKNANSILVVPMNPFLYEGMAGIAMYLFDTAIFLEDSNLLMTSKGLMSSAVEEALNIKTPQLSGYTGLASIIYSVNRCIEEDPNFLDEKLVIIPLIDIVAAEIENEINLDLLTGIAGIGLALLPFVKRTSNKSGKKVLRHIFDRLKAQCSELPKNETKIDGLDYLRGFSHGLSGVSLCIHRLGLFFKDLTADELASELLLYESDLACGNRWTDEHKLQGKDLVGWCHGSSGIALALNSMPSVVSSNVKLTEYLAAAEKNTANCGAYTSQCLCHGEAGNLFSIKNFHGQGSHEYYRERSETI